jgi:hypothetical protein
MKKTGFAFAILAAALTAMAAGPDHEHPAPAKTNPGFEMLKQLSGNWSGTAQHGDGQAQDGAKVEYRLTGAGSVVMETLFPGTEHEMVTMYYLDGDDLVMTHYCSMGNQPHMKAQAFKAEAGKPATLRFACTGGGTNMTETDAHMHAAELTFTDKDHLAARWTMYEDSKPGMVATFTLTRAGK